jgi:hypothetical protein
MSRASLDEHIADAMKLSGSKERFSGVVSEIDASGTTVTIQSGERQFLAFQFRGKQKLVPGHQVTFRIDQLRAVDVEIQPAIGERNSEEKEE